MKFVMQNKFFWVFLLVVFALPVLPHPIRTPEYWITLLNYIGLYSIVAIGLVLLTGIGGMTSFGQAAFVGVGAYSTAYLTTQFGVSPWLALIVGMVLTALIALLLGMVTMRLSGHFLPLGTIAWGLSLFFLFGNLDFLGKYDGINGIPVLNLFGWHLESGRSIYYLIWVVVLLSVISVQNLLNSRPGRAIRALRGGGTMAEAMGVNTAWMRVVIFVYAAVLAAVRAFAAGRESDAVRSQSRHRVPLHGGGGGRVACVGCGIRRDDPHRSARLSADVAAQTAGIEWQF
jgi:ABC-type branched-subunit amino acid transport system permease subunit